jgi:hypothetical protein
MNPERKIRVLVAKPGLVAMEMGPMIAKNRFMTLRGQGENSWRMAPLG